MNNTFLIKSASFDESDVDFSELERLVHQLHDQVMQINSHKGNKISVIEEIYDSCQWKGHYLGEIWQDDCELDHDLKIRLQSMLMNYGDDNDNRSNIGENGYGLLTLKIRECYREEDQVADTEHSWYKFCLNKLMCDSMTSDNLLDDCKVLFDNLEILDRNYSTICEIYDDFKQSIVHHLNGLNKYLREAQSKGKNRTDILKCLSILGKFHEYASPEGDAKRKVAFTFEVDSKKVCCEPHIKLCKSDNPGDNTYYFHRIYFYEGDPSIRKGKIIVGHIGRHL